MVREGRKKTYSRKSCEPLIKFIKQNKTLINIGVAYVNQTYLSQSYTQFIYEVLSPFQKKMLYIITMVALRLTANYDHFNNVYIMEPIWLRKKILNTLNAAKLPNWLCFEHSHVVQSQQWMSSLYCLSLVLKPPVFIMSMFEHFHQVESSHASAILHYGPKQTVTCGLIIACF